MRGNLPVPVRQTELAVVDELAEDALVKIQIGAMPREELPVSVDRRGAHAAEPAVDVRLVSEAARIVGVVHRQIAHRLVGILELLDFRGRQRRGWTARPDGAAIRSPGSGAARRAGGLADRLRYGRNEECARTQDA